MEQSSAAAFLTSLLTNPAVLAWRVLSLLAALYAIVAACRWIYRVSPVAGAIVAAGMAGRIVLGFCLFAISYLELPVFSSLQLGEGFWILALDARTYFNQAALAAEVGLHTISDGSASPTYVRSLAIWMMVFGVTPLSAVLLNAFCFLAVAVLIVDASRARQEAGIVALAALTVSPALVIFSTQPLKDTFCVLLIAMSLYGIRSWHSGLDSNRPLPASGLLLGATILVISVYALSGVRAYLGLFLIVATGASGITMLVSAASARGRVALAHLAIMPVLWGAFATGAGAYYPYYELAIRSTLSDLGAPVDVLDTARRGFIDVGGETSTAPSAGLTAQGEPGGLFSRTARTTMASRVRHLLRGCALLFVPISLLRALSVVEFSGGRGLLFVTDIDTLVIDAGLAAALYLLFLSRRHPALPVIVFVVVFAALTTVALAYVVTNFGTLFRLRLLAVTPLWMLPALVGSNVRPVPSWRWWRTGPGEIAQAPANARMTASSSTISSRRSQS